MAPKPKRRWYQFTIRALLMLMTLAGIVLARVAYLRHWAAYHEHEAERYAWKVENGGTGFDMMLVVDDLEALRRHTTLASRFRTAVYRPWMIVDKTLPPKEVLNFAEPEKDESPPYPPGDSADPFGK